MALRFDHLLKKMFENKMFYKDPTELKIELVTKNYNVQQVVNDVYNALASASILLYQVPLHPETFLSNSKCQFQGQCTGSKGMKHMAEKKNAR